MIKSDKNPLLKAFISFNVNREALRYQQQAVLCEPQESNHAMGRSANSRPRSRSIARRLGNSLHGQRPTVFHRSQLEANYFRGSKVRNFTLISSQLFHNLHLYPIFLLEVNSLTLVTSNGKSPNFDICAK